MTGRCARTGLLALALFAVAAALSVGYWMREGRPVAMADVPGGMLDCVSYTPYDGSSSPLNRAFDADAASIRADLQALRPYAGCIRTYSALGPVPKAVAIAAELKFEVWQGIWISGNAAKDEMEIEAGVQLAKAYRGTISRLVVGNEVLLRREMPASDLARITRAVKARAPVPVTYADIYEFWRRNPELAQAVDIVTLHVLPYWDDPMPFSIDDVQASVAGVIQQMRNQFPAAEIAIGEAGWPSLGRTRGEARPSRVNQARFMREFVISPAVKGMRVNLIEGIDQAWKRGPEGTVGGYWGVLDADRNLKFPLTGPVVERPEWRHELGVALSLALAVFVAGLVRFGRNAGPAPWPGIAAWAVVSHIAGTALVEATVFVWTVARDPVGWLGGVGGLVLALVALGLLARTILGPRPWGTQPLKLSQLASRLGLMRLGLRDGAAWLGLWRAALLLPVAWLALAIGLDGRHRDLPVALLLLPALALLALSLGANAKAGRQDNDAEGPEEAWLAVALLVGALSAFEGLANAEAA
ncbi:MAG: hypothetical protein O3A88_03460, partial [Proteobacteria bacterium]|nr:hypothetical protein [Pseudomonadota bacterium]